jgi:hypothetical protein
MKKKSREEFYYFKYLRLNLNELPKLIQKQNEQLETDSRLLNRNRSCSGDSVISNDDCNDDNLHRNKDFEKHRKEHYNEFKMAQLLRDSIKDEGDDEEDDNMNNHA